jgi:hypothetical protein
VNTRYQCGLGLLSIKNATNIVENIFDTESRLIAIDISTELNPLFFKKGGKNCTNGPVTEKITVNRKLITQKNDTL